LEVTGMRFNREGDKFAVSGGFDDLGISVFDFPGLDFILRYVYSEHDLSKKIAYHIDDGGPVLHPDGERLLAPRSSGSIVEVDLTTGEETRCHRVFDVPCTTIDADDLEGLVIACSARGEVTLLEVESE
jgi:hypothetical protein